MYVQLHLCSQRILVLPPIRLLTMSGYSWSSWNRGTKSWQSQSGDWWSQQSASVPAPEITLPSSFKSDETFFDSTAVGAGNHQFYRHVQPTEWSRKANLAGRPVEDIRVHELCLRGMGEFSLRMLSEGKFQSLVWTRNAAEGVLVTQLLKAIRDAKIDIDTVATQCLREKSLPIPDKHKQAAQFMTPLIELMMKEVRSKAPIENSQNLDREELVRAKAKLAQAGLSLTPRKSLSESAENDPCPSESGNNDSSALELPSGSGKKRKALPMEHDDATEAKKLLSGKAFVSLKNNRPSSVTNEHVDSWLQSLKPQYKGKFRELTKHVSHVVRLLSEHSDKTELIKAATAFGLDAKFASRLSVSNLSKCIAVAKYQAA